MAGLNDYAVVLVSADIKVWTAIRTSQLKNKELVDDTILNKDDQKRLQQSSKAASLNKDLQKMV